MHHSGQRCFVNFLKSPMLHLFIFHQTLSWRSSRLSKKKKRKIHFISRKQIYKSISPSDYSVLQKRCSFHLECILPLKVPRCGHFHISIFQPATRSQINYPRKKRPPTSAGSLVSAGYYRASRCSRKVGVSVFSCLKGSLTALRRRRGKKGHF